MKSILNNQVQMRSFLGSISNRRIANAMHVKFVFHNHIDSGLNFLKKINRNLLGWRPVLGCLKYSQDIPNKGLTRSSPPG